MLLGCLWVGALVGYLYLARAGGHDEQAAVQRADPTTVTVGSRSDDLRKSITAIVRFGPVSHIVTTASGTLTAIHVSQGDSISDCTPLIAIDDQDVLAMRGESPAYRDLRLGDKGRDVNAVAVFLADCGILSRSDVGSTYGRPMQDATKELQSRLGTRADGVFHPAYVAFIPQDTVGVDSTPQSVGSPVAVGSTILSVRTAPRAVEFQPTAVNGTLADLAGKSLTLAVGDRSIALRSLPVPTEDASTVYSFLTGAVGPGRTLSDDTSSLAFDGAMLRLTQPRTWGTVPMTALYGSPAAKLCVFLAQDVGRTANYAARDVTGAQPSIGEVGASLVPDDLVGAEVVRSPGSLPAQVLGQCR